MARRFLWCLLLARFGGKQRRRCEIRWQWQNLFLAAVGGGFAGVVGASTVGVWEVGVVTLAEVLRNLDE